MTPRYFYYTVRVVRADSRARLRSYIEEAVQAWGGQFEPRDGGYEHPDKVGDPLGPPCVLGEPGAVIVTAQNKPTRRFPRAQVKSRRST